MERSRTFDVLLVLLSCFVLVQNFDHWRVKRQTVEEENSKIEADNDCRCVSYYQCDENNTIITNGQNLIDTRLGETTSPKPQDNAILCKGGSFDGELMCCKLINSTETSESSSPSTSESSTASQVTPSPLPITSEKPVTSESPDPDMDNKTEKREHPCGVQRPKINVRIFADDEENPVDGEFPWITAIYKKKANDPTWKFYCSGALIHPRVVLTANHYFLRRHPEDFKVVLNGNIELSAVGADSQNERIVEEIVNHPGYYSGGLYYDASLLILDKPYESTNTNSINTICLPPDDVEINKGRCLVAGWGKGSTEDGVTILKKVELPMVEFNKCQDLLRGTRLGKYFNLHESFVCAGGEKDKDACKGDGGSPLMCPFPAETGRYFHMGIVSWGIGCGQTDIPGVYGSTPKMKRWILEELNKRNL